MPESLGPRAHPGRCRPIHMTGEPHHEGGDCTCEHCLAMLSPGAFVGAVVIAVGLFLVVGWLGLRVLLG